MSFYSGMWRLLLLSHEDEQGRLERDRGAEEMLFGGCGEVGCVWGYVRVSRWWESAMVTGDSAGEGVNGVRAARNWALFPSPKGCQLPQRNSRPHTRAFLAGRCFYCMFGNHWVPRFWRQDDQREKRLSESRRCSQSLVKLKCPRALWRCESHLGAHGNNTISMHIHTWTHTHTTAHGRCLQKNCPDLTDNTTNNVIKQLLSSMYPPLSRVALHKTSSG